ncbi:aromatic ring-hydroxylating dioxygenase subunit alpha [Metapseudomonas furukawaii]|uniref:aromatic ring-hydroxylating dioxygenase subunit alpha n=2 Tax=Gammaproteobacteria TaxID=1236 RepID=UPI00227A07B4|nr:aromatic ring-hydroxylating dioxygenase subunit alpha [Pseudomonas furukawaii]WAG81555.1 aromatic ring-hydroxylating dioxygenase subunit alpha [Pseudomonas furukawaii]
MHKNKKNDGTNFDVSGLVDPDGGLVSPTIYTDQEIYERELEMVFGRSWLFLAHESQIPDRGNFVQTYMGEDPVLVVRQRDGSVKAFLNQCRHRGMRICRSDGGTAKTFTCTYHGWAYDLEGNLINVPSEDRAYHCEIDKSQWGASKVPRIANYKGFIFGTWSEEVPEFEDYLGEMAYHFDSVVARWDNGFEFVSGATKWVIDCNWKIPAEQSASDMYHAPTSHMSAMLALAESGGGWDLTAFLDAPGHQSSGNGHGSGFLFKPSFDFPDPAYGPKYVEWMVSRSEEQLRNLGPERALRLANHQTLFPNFSFLGDNLTMRVWHPRGPGQIEVWAWIYMPKDAPQEVKDLIRLGTQRTFSAAGAFETDDGENWTEIQQVLRGWRSRSNQFNVQMGLGHASLDKDIPGVGTGRRPFSEEAARGFYRRWGDLMSGLSWADIVELDKARRSELPIAEEVQQA